MNQQESEEIREKLEDVYSELESLMENEMNRHEAQKMAEKLTDIYRHLEALKEYVSECLIESLSVLDSSIAKVLSQLPTDNKVAFVGGFAALDLAYRQSGSMGNCGITNCAQARPEKCQ